MVVGCVSLLPMVKCHLLIKTVRCQGQDMNVCREGGIIYESRTSPSNYG